jgi:hypothetical protein
MAYATLANTTTCVAETAPRAVRITRGTVEARKATKYFRPTLSMSRAQRMEATAPTADVTQP